MEMTLTRPITAAAAPAMVVPIDGTGGNLVPLTAAQLRTSNDAVLRETVANAAHVMSFLKERFGRDGIDGKGQPLQVVVHAAEPQTGGRMNNAYWDGQQGRMYIGDGDGTTFAPLGRARDIVAHEAGHAVLESVVRMGFTGQQGALHESFGDVLGALVDPDDWQIGEDAFTPARPGDALRDMSRPQRFRHMDDVTPGQEPHLLADIPNLAAVRAAEKIGRHEMGRVWFTGFTEHLKDYATFPDAAAATVKAAKLLYGDASPQASAVAEAWTSVGVLQPSPAA